MTRDNKQTTKLSDVEKSMLEVLSEGHDCSQSAYIRDIIVERWKENCGDVHPKIFNRHDMDIEAFLRGEIDPDEVNDGFKMDGDSPAKVPASDGGVGAAVSPGNHTPTQTPVDLAKSGPELTYDELKDAVTKHWDDDLEIHPDRVRASEAVEFLTDDCEDYSEDPYALKSSRATVSKVLAGILRTHGDEVPEQIVEETILKYTSHQITRADKKAGERYKVERYTEALVERYEYLIPHPDPLKDMYYTSEAAAKEHLGKEITETIEKLIDQSSWVLDPKAHAQEQQVNPKKDPSEWINDLASFRQRLGYLHAVRESEYWASLLTELDNDLFDEFPTPQVAVGKTFTEMINQYLRVNQWARFAAAHAVLEVTDETVLEAEIYDGDEPMTVNPDRPAQPVMEWVTERGEPLSPGAQIEAVAEKL